MLYRLRYIVALVSLSALFTGTYGISPTDDQDRRPADGVYECVVAGHTLLVPERFKVQMLEDVRDEKGDDTWLNRLWVIRHQDSPALKSLEDLQHDFIVVSHFPEKMRKFLLEGAAGAEKLEIAGVSAWRLSSYPGPYGEDCVTYVFEHVTDGFLVFMAQKWQQGEFKRVESQQGNLIEEILALQHRGRPR